MFRRKVDQRRVLKHLFELGSVTGDFDSLKLFVEAYGGDVCQAVSLVEGLHPSGRLAGSLHRCRVVISGSLRSARIVYVAFFIAFFSEV